MHTGLYLSGFDPSRVKADPKVKEFYGNIPNKIILEKTQEKDPNIKIINLV